MGWGVVTKKRQGHCSGLGAGPGRGLPVLHNYPISKRHRREKGGPILYARCVSVINTSGGGGGGGLYDSRIER